MNNEKKYIIANVHGKVKHLVFPSCLYHDTFARDNGIDTHSQVIETGLLIEGKSFIVTCKDRQHAQRREYRQSLPSASLKAREAQTRYAYGIERQGD